MIRLRLDWRLRGKISSSSILEQIYLDVCRSIRDYLSTPDQSFYLWVREIAGQRLEAIHRRHLGERTEDNVQEIRLYSRPMPAITATSIAAQLLGDRGANEAAAKAQMQLGLQTAVNSMEMLDREILALRNFEELSNEETASVLRLSSADATVRYLQAMRRLNKLLASIPGFFPTNRT